MIVALIITTLGLVWGWATLRTVLPWALPEWLSPFLVLAMALALSWPDWHLALAAAGAAGILHFLLRDQSATEKQVVLRRPSGRIPPLP